MTHILRCFTSLVALLSIATIASAQTEGTTSAQTVSYDAATTTLTLGGDFSTWPDLSEYKSATKVVFASDFKATTIGASAFSWFQKLEAIEIPSSVTSIGNSAFEYGTNLNSVTIHEGVTSIGEYAFYRCAFTSITLPESLESISTNAFNMCEELTSIVIPEGVKRIENYTFQFCKKLVKVTLPASLESIGNQAFEYCDEITSVVLYSNGTENDKHYVCLGEPNITDKTARGHNVFTSAKAYLTYNPKTTYIGGNEDDDSTDNLRSYFDFAHLIKDESLSPTATQTSLRLTPAAVSAAQYYDLGGRKVDPSTFKGVAVKVHNGRSSLTIIK